MEIEEFRIEMDKQEPSWFIDHANEQELKTYARYMLRDTTQKNYHTEKLRTNVSHRLFVCARATHQFLLRDRTDNEK